MKLNYPKTIKVGLAFAIIMVFWSAYDFVVPLLLENAYGLSNTLRGLIMGLDNLLSLFMLPLFGKISDKTKTRFGRRTPYIFIGTLLSVVLMVFVPISATKQLKAADALKNSYEVRLNEDEFMSSQLKYFYEEAEDGNSVYCDLSYLKMNNISKEDYIAIRFDDKLVSKSGFLGIGGTTYTYEGESVELTDVIGGKTVEQIVDGNANYKKFVASGMNAWLSEQVNSNLTQTKEGTTSIALYMIILLLVLISMATFRSPAVALMPDVTPKPLRSQANAIINLMGGIGGAVAFLIYTIVLFGDNINNYTIIFGCVAASMVMFLTLFLIFNNERKLVKECEDICVEYGITDEDEDEKVQVISNEVSADESIPAYSKPIEKKVKSPEEKAKLKSFILILASIFMWFMGYNAISSSLSIYITKALNLGAGIGGIISGVSMGISAIAFIPVGFLAVKIGRKKSIMLGFGLAVISFILLYVPIVRPNDNALIPSVLFALFYLIAGFGLIIANVNTFPMVVELAKAEDVGKYTGFYYTATMSAQAITPMIAGLVMDYINMYSLFLYSAVCVAIAIALMAFVKHGDSKAVPKSKLEMLGEGD